MKAVVFHGVGDIRIDDVPEPRLEASTDAIIRITGSAICGTDLHFVRGSYPDMEHGTVLGHEAVGVVEQLGDQVRNLSIGDRVVVASTIACGSCSYCRAGYFAQCDANPGGKRAGTTFFGGPRGSGSIHGLQAEKARIPFAHVGLIKIPDDVTDEQAILLSDIFPTGYFAAELAEISDGDSVVVFGCGPVGQFAICSAKLLGAGRVLAVDRHEDRLQMARRQGAEVINFDKEDPIQTILDLTGGIGVDRAIDAVGVDSEAPGKQHELTPPLSNSRTGAAPGQALQWAVESLAKAGTLAIVGVYPPTATSFPIGMAMSRNLTIKMGNCNHRKYIPHLFELVRSGVVKPEQILTQVEPFEDVLKAYQSFGRAQNGWIKVELDLRGRVKEERTRTAEQRQSNLEKALEDTYPASDPATHA